MTVNPDKLTTILGAIGAALVAVSRDPAMQGHHDWTTAALVAVVAAFGFFTNRAKKT